MQETYQVVIGISWGGLPKGLQQRWTEVDCDTALSPAEPPPHALVETHQPFPATTGSSRVESGGGGEGAMPSSGPQRQLPMAHAGGASFLLEYERRHVATLAGREPHRRIARNQTRPGSSRAGTATGAATGTAAGTGAGAAKGVEKGGVVIAVCASTTSRGLHPSSLGQLSLFRLALPSLRATFSSGLQSALAAGEAPPELWIYIAFDKGDAFYDNPSREAAVRSWLDEHVVAPLAKEGVRARHALLRFENALRKPVAAEGVEP